MKKIATVTLALLLVLVSVVAFARFSYIGNMDATLSLSGSTATCFGEVKGQSTSYSCSISVKLQKKSGASWSTIKTWTDSGTGSTNAGGTYTVSSGTYRVYVTGNVAGESFSLASNTKTK